MSTIDDIREVRALRARRDLTRVDYARTIRRLVKSGRITQTELAEALNVSQGSVSQLAKSVEEVPPRFSGASPYEIAQRYAAGEIDHDQVVAQLTTWEYDVADGSTDGIDSLMVDAPGAHTFDEVGRAYREGLIDADIYNSALDAVAGVGHPREA